MTNEKAIEMLKINIDDCVTVEKKAKCFCKYSVMKEASLMAINALEKQISKKPNYLPNDDTCLYYHYECPNCWEHVYKGDHHCSCGQKLDWSIK